MPEQITKQRFVPVRDVIDAIGLGRTSVYRLINEGRIASIRFGNTVRVPADELERVLREGC